MIYYVIILGLLSLYLLLAWYAEAKGGLLKTDNGNGKESLRVLMELDKLSGLKIRKLRVSVYFAIPNRILLRDIEREQVMETFGKKEKVRVFGILKVVDTVYKIDYREYCSRLEIAYILLLHRNKLLKGRE